ncbi:MAG: BlaI/MecI/CopY family transcriptional regulator [Candidatus Heteroscillospira sp.]|jgi:BlaI family penicillinase repressor
MSEEKLSLTTAEWSVMECLWERSPLTGREAVEMLGKKMGWTRSTTLTLLRRLEAKGAVSGNSEGGVKSFHPLLRREDAAARETEDLLDRVYQGSLSLLVSSLTRKQALPKEEIDELYAILREMEADSDA